MDLSLLVHGLFLGMATAAEQLPGRCIMNRRPGEAAGQTTLCHSHLPNGWV